jgi:predicted transcriptional regulator
MKRKTTIYIDDAILRALKIAAARSGQHDYEVVEQALRAHLGMELLQRAGKKDALSEQEALNLAYRELHRSRKR